jgi:hypothetical protein
MNELISIASRLHSLHQQKLKDVNAQQSAEIKPNRVFKPYRKGGGSTANCQRGQDTKGTPGSSSTTQLQSPNKKSSTLECFYCHKKGHIISECRTRLANLKKGQFQPSNDALLKPV